MEIGDYLREKERKFERSRDRLRDSRVFDANYVPERPLMRAELKPIIDALVRYQKTGIPNHLLVTGSRGCGKTLSVLYLRTLFEARGCRFLYSNCRTHNTSFKILAHLLGVRARGVSFSELAERFADRYPARTVVVLDEVDLLSDKDKNKDLLYFLSRAEGNYMAVLLSNNPKWLNTLDQSIQSTLQPELIYFRPYTLHEMHLILVERSRLGLRRNAEGVLQETAALAVKYANSDVRAGLKTLYYWAVEPGTSLDENFQRARRDIIVDVIRNLTDKTLLILKAAAGTDRPVKEVYECYRRLCARYREDPFSYVYFTSNLCYLQSLGLLLLISTKVSRTYTRVMQLTFPLEILDMLWRLRFGD